jgi:hypothetical protein
MGGTIVIVDFGSNMTVDLDIWYQARRNISSKGRRYETSFCPDRCVNGDISSKNDNHNRQKACWFGTTPAHPYIRRRRYDDHDHDMAIFVPCVWRYDRLPAQYTSPSHPYQALSIGESSSLVVIVVVVVADHCSLLSLSSYRLSLAGDLELRKVLGTSSQ